MAQSLQSSGVPYTLEQAEEDIGALRGLVDFLPEQLTQDDYSLLSNTPPNVPSLGHLCYDWTGHEKYLSAADSNAYATGRLTLAATGALSVSAALQTVPGLTVNLAVGNYEITGQLLLNPTVGGSTMEYQGTQTNSLNVTNGRLAFVDISGTGTVLGSNYSTFGNLIAMNSNLGTTQVVSRFEGYAQVGTAGTLSIQARFVAAAATCSILQFGSIMRIWPVP